jgi:citrate lyase beta subunit
MKQSAMTPLQVLYGGAHLFSADTFAKIQRLALAALPEDAAQLSQRCSASISEDVHARIKRKLETAPLDDYRIDFEDGYGVRGDEEEDAHAAQAARALKSATDTPPFIGVRIKAFTAESRPRALRTLAIFLRELGTPPPGFVVTLPKVTTAEEVKALCAAAPGAIELMLETPEALQSLSALLATAGGRVTSVHFGAYDFLSALGVVAAHQSLTHPLCVYARAQAQVALAGRVRFSDGATILLPVPPYRAPATEAERNENTAAIDRAFAAHYANVHGALTNGIYQGWDLHPAQLVPRYAAAFAFFRHALADTTARLQRFFDAAARATVSGGVFDDAATGQGLLNFFVRGHACGALDDADLAHAGLDLPELASGSFPTILRSRVTSVGST